MTESIYNEYRNKYYNPDDNDKRPGDNENWESVQKGFSRIGTTQLETSEGLTLGKGTEDEVILTPAELIELKDGNGIITAVTHEANTMHGVSGQSYSAINKSITFSFSDASGLEGRYKLLSSVLRSATNGVYVSGALLPSTDTVVEITNNSFTCDVEFIAVNTSSASPANIKIIGYLTLEKIL